jgi:hypothetical protein
LCCVSRWSGSSLSVGISLETNVSLWSKSYIIVLVISLWNRSGRGTIVSILTVVAIFFVLVNKIFKELLKWNVITAVGCGSLVTVRKNIYGINRVLQSIMSQ